MVINLSEIPEEGKSFQWSRASGELNSVLGDLIASAPYSTEFFIRPINHRDFEMTGSISTQSPEDCSRCGIEFNFSICQKFHEILIPPQPQDRQGKYARVNHVSETLEDGPSTVEYQSHYQFPVGEYLHELVAIAIPFNPAPEEDKAGNCSLCKIPVQGRSFSYIEEMPVENENKPFSVLKNLKVQ